MKPTLNQMPIGKLSPAGKDAVFLWVYARDFQVYKEEETRPAIILNLRHDGTFGTMGGKVDEGETLKEALARECIEEMNFYVHDIDTIVPLCTHEVTNGWHIHAFSLEVSVGDLFSIRANLPFNMMMSPEVAGANIAVLSASVVVNLCGQGTPWTGSGKEEFILLCKMLMPEQAIFIN